VENWKRESGKGICRATVSKPGSLEGMLDVGNQVRIQKVCARDIRQQRYVFLANMDKGAKKKHH